MKFCIVLAGLLISASAHAQIASIAPATKGGDSLAITTQNTATDENLSLDLEREVDVIASHASKFLSEVDLSLTASEEIARRKSATVIVQHASLRAIVERVPGLRAILSVSPIGQLEVDSFTYPTPVLNLAGRSYFQLALSRPGELIITQPEIGKTSGVPFMPAARANTDGVLVGVINPGGLLPPRLCTRCVAFAIDQNGLLLAANPPGSQMLGMRPDVGMDKASGRANLGNYSARYALQRAGRFGVWVILMLVD